jgi:hypothetical protein
MPGLATRTTSLGISQQLLRLRSCLDPALLTRLGPIRGRGLRAVARAGARLLLEPSHPLLKPLAAPRQLLAAPRQPEDELDATLPAGVVDRLPRPPAPHPPDSPARGRSLLS